MSGFFKKSKPPHADIRDMLFGDVPIDRWVATSDGADAAEPWRSFLEARKAIGKGDRDGAIAALLRITRMEGLESRQTLQAWHFIRGLGAQPAAEHAKRVRGVVLEVHLDGGLDTLAGYADHRARYLNYSGKIIIWESTDPAIDQLIDALIEKGQRVADAIGPWEEARRGPPPKRFVRINMLTDLGLHFGEGPLDALGRNPMAAPVVAAGTSLMQALIGKATATSGRARP